jgi:hypothetical protein
MKHKWHICKDEFMNELFYGCRMLDGEEALQKSMHSGCFSADA